MALGEVSTFEGRYLWIQVSEQLKFHNKGTDRSIDTLNRLWRKNPRTMNANGVYIYDLPVLTEEMLAVSSELWSLPQLEALEPPHERDQLRSFAPPIVLTWFDRDFLMDGNTRVNFWVKGENQGPHAVLRIRESGVPSNTSLERTRER
jgi:hypothetical protein